ncbi:hypothetical protein [Allosphingosinicella sp.]|jgi:hypothetical protein|uniref:hypothetical protein n=1 Tax=Allosphingosinicella sp. TaxID=2823234 RepID=UPI002F213C1D
MKTLPLLLALAGFSACADVPRDPDGTLDRVSSSRGFRVGVIAGGPSQHSALQRSLVERVAATTGARPALEQGAAEPLLLRLEQGELDLVVGEFQHNSPWAERVHLLPPLARTRIGEEEAIVAGAARHGENGWIMLLDRESRASAGAE